MIKALKAWDAFWFTPADPTLLGLIRICCGLVVLYVHFAYTYDLQNLFGEHAWLDLQTVNEYRAESPVALPSTTWEDATQQLGPPRDEEQAGYIKAYSDRWGVDPRQAYAKGQPIWSIWFHVTDPQWMQVVHSAILVTIFLFTIGFCTRVTSVLTWAAMLSYIHRSSITLFGMDTIMIVAVLYLTIGPSGAALSVDRLLARYRATRQALRNNLPVPALDRPEPRISANLALRLMQIHICIIYFVAGISKLQGELWWNGNAVWATMANYEFSPVRFQLYADFLAWLPRHRWLWETVTTGLTYATLAFEIGFPFLIWLPRLRWTMLVSAVLMHLSIAFFMGLDTFGLMMLTLVLSFVPMGAVYRFLWRLGRGPAGVQLAPAGV
jgi:hypothetical protein